MKAFLKKKSKKNYKISVKTVITKLFLLTLGAFIAGFALEGFLIPNEMIDGGVIGISMILSHITKWNLGLIIVCLNIPFIFLAFRKMGKIFVAQTFYAVMILALSVNVFHSFQATETTLLGTVFGGVILGFGVGLVLRSSAALDGTEILSMSLSKKLGFSVGEIIMFINLFIYTCAGFVYGWDSAMYSIITYFIAYRTIDIVLEGLNTSKSIRIISDFAKEIGDEIMKELDLSVTYVKSKGGYSGQEKIMLYCVVNRLEMPKVKELMKLIDPAAFIVIQDVYEVEGVRVKKK